MTKVPAFATFLAAAAILSGCQPCPNCQSDDSYWTEDASDTWTEVYPETSAEVSSDTWTEVYPETSVEESSDESSGTLTEEYPAASEVSDSWTEMYPDLAVEESSDTWTEEYPSVSAGGNSWEEAVTYDDSVEYVSQPYYSEEPVDSGSWTEEYPIDSSYIINDASSWYSAPSYSSGSNPSYTIRRYPPSVSYPSNMWQTRFIGQQPSSIYYPNSTSAGIPQMQQAVMPQMQQAIMSQMRQSMLPGGTQQQSALPPPFRYGVAPMPYGLR